MEKKDCVEHELACMVDYRKVRSLREAVKLRPSGRRYKDFPQQKIFLINLLYK
jgi:hypothetical protein